MDKFRIVIPQAFLNDKPYIETMLEIYRLITGWISALLANHSPWSQIMPVKPGIRVFGRKQPPEFNRTSSCLVRSGDSVSHQYVAQPSHLRRHDILRASRNRHLRHLRLVRRAPYRVRETTSTEAAQRRGQ